MNLFLILAQSAPPPAAGPVVASLWDFVVKGGPTMIPLGVVSVVALTIIVERFMTLRRSRVLPPGLPLALRGAQADRARAMELCASHASPLATILSAAIRRRGEPREQLAATMREAGLREVAQMRKHMRLLSALPQTATMLGLLGTVVGMIRTFQSVAASAEALGKAERLAQGIYEAWAATAGGLLVAIPVLVCYHILLGRIDARVAELDRAASDWLDDAPAAAPAPRPPEPAAAPVEPVPALAVGT